MKCSNCGCASLKKIEEFDDLESNDSKKIESFICLNCGDVCNCGDKKPKQKQKSKMTNKFKRISEPTKICPHCNSDYTIKRGVTQNKQGRSYLCRNCNKYFTIKL